MTCSSFTKIWPTLRRSSNSCELKEDKWTCRWWSLSRRCWGKKKKKKSSALCKVIQWAWLDLLIHVWQTRSEWLSSHFLGCVRKSCSYSETSLISSHWLRHVGGHIKPHGTHTCMFLHMCMYVCKNIQAYASTFHWYRGCFTVLTYTGISDKY